LKYVSEFRKGNWARALAREIRELAGERRFRFMEVCGTHTMSIYRHGIRSLLPESIELISGPGCPVCVTPPGYIDLALKLSVERDILIASFGDMVRVPGSERSLADARAQGASVQVCYSPTDALRMAGERSERQVVFLGVGFETTAPVVAGVILRAQEMSLKRFSVLSAHKLIPPAMRILAESGVALDGFLCPAHVSVVIGTEPYRFLAEEHHLPCVVTGFEPSDILQGVRMLVRQAVEGRAVVENQYSRAAKRRGNPKALATMEKVFEPVTAPWRGLGPIPGSGLRIREDYRRFDAESVFGVAPEEGREPAGCRCGEVLRGLERPERCPLFGSRCTPLTPVGACMVSSEGACAAAFKYGGTEKGGSA